VVIEYRVLAASLTVTAVFATRSNFYACGRWSAGGVSPAPITSLCVEDEVLRRVLSDVVARLVAHASPCVGLHDKQLGWWRRDDRTLTQ